MSYVTLNVIPVDKIGKVLRENIPVFGEYQDSLYSDRNVAELMAKSNLSENAQAAHPGLYLAGNLAGNAALTAAGGGALRGLGIASQAARDAIMFGTLGTVGSAANQDWSAPGKATLNTALGGGLGALGGYLGGKAAETAGAYLDQWAHVKGGNQLPEYRPSLANNKVEGYNGNRERVYETVKGLGKSAETSAEGAGNVINPNEIRFSQSSVNGVYKITASMKANGWQGEPIDVVKMSDGILTSVDNTRVASAREAGIDVRANVHGYNDPLTPDQMSRFATKKGIPTTWGEAIKLRIDKQNSAFRNSFPAGSFDLPMFK